MSGGMSDEDRALMAKAQERMLLATTEGAEVCPKCERPKAVARDVIRWLSGADGYAFACFNGAEYSRLLPDEEAVPGADLLKERLVDTRALKDQFACSMLEQELLGRRRRRA